MTSFTPADGYIVVANRGSSSLSIFNSTTGGLEDTISLDGSEPMYISNLGSLNQFAVGDRANNQVLFIDSLTLEVVDSVSLSDDESLTGIFHMWSSLNETQLWVVNDLNITLSVIEPGSTDEPQTIDLAPFIPGSARPHDVILDAHGHYAYVTVITAEENDLLLKFDAQTFDLIGSAEVGKDPHVSLAPEHNLLYVVSQDNSRVDIFDRRAENLSKVGSIDVPNAHGVIHSTDGRYLYVTNIADGGANAIFTIDTMTNEIVGDLDGVDVEIDDELIPTPHNLTVTNDGTGLFLTHSGGTATNTSFFSLVDPTTPDLQISVDGEGLNPFGLTAVGASIDDVIVKGGADNIVNARQGNDIVFGGGGNDHLRGQRGNDKLFGESGKDDLRGNSGDDVLIGGVRNDTLRGGHGKDLLIGVEVDSLTPGAGEIDIYRGGQDADTFVLGDALSAHYDDGDDNSLGLNDYGWIRDFKLSQGDVIRLHGSAEDYEVGIVRRQASIFYQSELIGVVDNVGSLDLTSDAFEYASVPGNTD